MHTCMHAYTCMYVCLCVCVFISTYIWFQHHCRNCGKVVCHPCSNKKWQFPEQSDKPLRVCLTCYHTLSNATENNTSPCKILISASRPIALYKTLTCKIILLLYLITFASLRVHIYILAYLVTFYLKALSNLNL